MAKADLSADRLRELLDYNPDTGIFTHINTAYCGANNRVRVRAGDVAGCVSKATGYVILNIFGKTYQAHRVAWLHHFGEWPKGEVDHKDGERTNNRISNLRDVSRSVNAQNQRRAPGKTSSGRLGVSLNRRNGRWYAKIKVDKKVHCLGGYASPDEAHHAYLEAKRRMHPGCTI